MGQFIAPIVTPIKIKMTPGYIGQSGYSGSGVSGYSGFSGDNPGSSGYSGYSGYSGFNYTLVASLASPVATNGTTALTDLTGLVWTYAANSQYVFRFIGPVQTASANAGVGFTLALSSAVTGFEMTFFHQAANSGTVTAGSADASDAVLGTTSGVPNANTNVPVNGSGSLRTGANTGTAQLRFRSETTAVATADTGMTLIVEKVA